MRTLLSFLGPGGGLIAFRGLGGSENADIIQAITATNRVLELRQIVFIPNRHRCAAQLGVKVARNVGIQPKTQWTHRALFVGWRSDGQENRHGQTRHQCALGTQNPGQHRQGLGIRHHREAAHSPQGSGLRPPGGGKPASPPTPRPASWAPKSPTWAGIPPARHTAVSNKPRAEADTSKSKVAWGPLPRFSGGRRPQPRPGPPAKPPRGLRGRGIHPRRAP